MTIVNLRAARTRIVRAVFALLGAAAMAVPLSAAAPSSAHAAAASCSITVQNGVFEIAYGCGGGLISASHACQQTGIVVNTDGTTTTDECADVAVADNAGGAQVWGEGEFYCQGDETECQGMNVSVYVYVENSSGTDYTSPATNYKCNPTIGFCPDGGRAMVSSPHFTATRGTCYFSYAIDPADGENGDPQVISAEEHAFHAESELRSNTVEFCFR